ncbi:MULTISPECIES: nucleotidyltransferase [Staphylococcus]|uniref:tRNA(Met) cytidine acetate ligase n=1 Tax=Staphylococcus hsinchuensis TaxID=3051183 RepID=A0ABZ3EAH5_9STAP|nr:MULTISPECIES: nucleotidyltransferase [unclassified Staphylococcus]
MKSVALITEYNPFHNGHLYHAKKAKSMTDADVSIAIMSGQFVMRGEPAIFNKFIRTNMALQAVDLVVELPALASLSAGPYFATSGVKIADYLEANHLVFGSESGDIDAFKSLSTELSHIEQSTEFLKKSKEGKSYPRIIDELMPDTTLLSSPNNILGLSYVKAINNEESEMKPWTIKRVHSDHHNSTIANNTFASGTAIRKSIFDGNELWQHVTPFPHTLINSAPPITSEDTFNFLKYAILTHSVNELKQIYTMSEGFEYRLKGYIKKANSFGELVNMLKTKRYTHTHIQRLLMNVLLNNQKNDYLEVIPAVRILGMNATGQAYLKYLKQSFPERNFITQVNQKNNHFFKNEIHATEIYNLLSPQLEQTDFNTPVIRK